MSDQTGLGIAFDDGLDLEELRAHQEEFHGKARLRTPLIVAGTGTLDGNADEVWADLTAGAFTYHLPVAPNDGDVYEFTKVDSSGNALTIGRNGKTINGAASDVTVSTQWASKRLTWSAAQNTWWSR
ncbi:MAG: hypothetical protein ABL998_00910 [Planctomycetota bacterium]